MLHTNNEEHNIQNPMLCSIKQEEKKHNFVTDSARSVSQWIEVWTNQEDLPENMIAGPQRIILYSNKREINITAGAIL